MEDTLQISTTVNYRNRMGHLMIDLTLNRPPVDLVLAVDTCGSMGSTAAKTQAIKRTVESLVGSLHERDRVALVCFAENSKVVRPLGSVKNFKLSRWFWERHRFNGSCNLGAGIRDSLSITRSQGESENTRQKHVIILTNGYPNQGITRHAAILKFFQTLHSRQPDTIVSTISYGLDYHQSLVTSLTSVGCGTTICLKQYSLKYSKEANQQLHPLLNRLSEGVDNNPIISIEPTEGTVVNQTTIPVSNLREGITKTWHVLFTPIPDHEFQSGDIIANITVDYLSTEDFCWSQIQKNIII